MSLVSFTPVTDGSTATAAGVNTPLSTIYNDYNGNITNANLSASAAIDFSKISGGSATALAAWTAFTPTFSNALTVGNGTHASYYQQVGKTVFVRVYFTFGSTSTMGTGSVGISLPVTARSAVFTAKQLLGHGLAISGAAEYPSVVEFSTTTLALMWAQTITASTPVLAQYSSTAPFTWTTGSVISANFVYEAA